LKSVMATACFGAVAFCVSGCCSNRSVVSLEMRESNGYFQVYKLDTYRSAPEQSTTDQEIVTENKIDSGGAIAISPSHILLTDHQVPMDWSSIQLGELVKAQSKVISSGEFLDSVDGVGDSRLGWELRAIDPPIGQEYVAELADPDGLEVGSECFIPTSARWFGYLNPDQCTAEEKARLFVRGRMVDIDEDPYGNLVKPFLSDDRFAIKVEAALQIQGSSGFPVLIQGNTQKEQLVIGLVLASVHSPPHDFTWIVAMKIPQEAVNVRP